MNYIYVRSKDMYEMRYDGVLLIDKPVYFLLASL